MTEAEALASMSRILGELLGDASIALTPETRRQDVPDWDSLNYVNFIVAIEIHFGIKFRVSEVESFETIGQIVARTLGLLAVRRS